MLLPVLALAIMQSACPILIGVSNDGSIFFDRFQGWIRVDITQLGDVLRQGCKTNFSSPPSPITSIRFAVGPEAPSSKVDQVFSLLEENGWTKENIKAEPWTSPLRKLSGRFYMDKQTFSVGEPVVVRFEVINSGNDPYWLDTTGLPGTPTCAGYTVRVFHPDRTPLSNGRLVMANTCILNGQFKHAVIDPGARYTQDIDLGLYLDTGAKGNYMIEVGHHALRQNGTPKDPLDCEATFKFQLR